MRVFMYYVVILVRSVSRRVMTDILYTKYDA